MKIDLEFVELYQPLFLDGQNFGNKLYFDHKKNKGAFDLLCYDTELRHLIIIFRGKVALIETVASMTLKDPTQLGLDVKPKQTFEVINQRAVQVQPPIKAQVSGPERAQAQVSTPFSEPPKAPRRPPRFQGEESQGE
jgi:hypothetical protein